MSQSDPSTPIPAGTPANQPNVIAITGGRGGVGKTSIAVNLAIALARMKNRVCLLDGDTGVANANVLLGLQPDYRLDHLIAGERSLQQVMLDGPEGLKVIPGATELDSCADLTSLEQFHLLQGLQELESTFDWLLVDTAAGVSELSIRMIDAAQMTVVVITPAPASLTDAFTLLKVMRNNGYRRQVLVVVNMVSASDQPQAIFRRFQSALEKYIGVESHYLGSVWMDESMRVAVASQKPVATLPLNDPSCRLFMRLADSLTTVFNAAPRKTRSMSEYWLQSLVELEISDTLESVSQTEPPLDQRASGEESEASLQTLLNYIKRSPLPHDKAYMLICALLERSDGDQFSADEIADIRAQFEKHLLANQPAATSSTSTAQERQSQEPRSPLASSDPQDTLAKRFRRLDRKTSVEEYLSRRREGKNGQAH